MDHAAEFCRADDVAHSNCRCFFRRCRKVWWEVISGRVRSFFVVVTTPDAADVIEMLFGNDDEFVQTFELQRLDESLDVGSQIG